MGELFVYIVKCANGALYTGYSTNVENTMQAKGHGILAHICQLPLVQCGLFQTREMLYGLNETSKVYHEQKKCSSSSRHNR
jgi:predicted GIY-YIG superfamily endonuclease